MIEDLLRAVLMIGFVLPVMLYTLSLQKALERCAPESRTMPQGQVWLLLVPLFNFVWHFVVVIRIARSLRSEFLRRQLPLTEAKPGMVLGLATCVLVPAAFTPRVGGICALAGLVCWIVYWVRITGYSRQIAELAWTLPHSHRLRIRLAPGAGGERLCRPGPPVPGRPSGKALTAPAPGTWSSASAIRCPPRCPCCHAADRCW